VVENERNQIIVYGAVEQTVYLPKYRLLLLSDPQWLSRGVGDLLLDRLMSDLVEAKAITVSCRQYASETELVELLKSRGFEETSRVFDLRLDVAAVDVASLLPVLKGIEEQGITITTFAEERDRDPRCVEKLYELTTALSQDDPARGPLAPPAYNAREALMWMQMSYVLPDAYFIAKRGDEYVGVSDVSLFEAVPGALTQGFTGVKREYRRRGLATALKVHEILYARSHGYQVIQSFNKPEQTTIRALNEKLGFELMRKHLMLEKCLRDVVEVDTRVYEEYVGRYRDGDHELVVRNEAGRLTLECVGQKVQLFPASETSFFVKYFYGEVTFDRDGLDFTMRVPGSEPVVHRNYKIEQDSHVNPE
jgi:GNAT superfamily N-acetyltransferase